VARADAIKIHALPRSAAMRWRRSWVLRAQVLLAAVLMLGAVLAPAARELESLDAFPRSRHEIRTSAGSQRFVIWVADTPARSQQGLMFVRALAPDRGMLFPLDRRGVIRMWMKDTRIALDMLFIDSHGQIIYIRHNATRIRKRSSPRRHR
jgi:uncharacterized membrane protein (UPF0127 family)